MGAASLIVPRPVQAASCRGTAGIRQNLRAKPT
jgi:hypothetical protein